MDARHSLTTGPYSNTRFLRMIIEKEEVNKGGYVLSITEGGGDEGLNNRARLVAQIGEDVNIHSTAENKIHG